LLVVGPLGLDGAEVAPFTDSLALALPAVGTRRSSPSCPTTFPKTGSIR